MSGSAVNMEDGWEDETEDGWEDMSSSEDSFQADMRKTLRKLEEDEVEIALAEAEESLAVKPESRPLKLCLVRRSGDDPLLHLTGPIIWNQPELWFMNPSRVGCQGSLESIRRAAQGCETCDFVCKVLEGCMGVAVEQLVESVQIVPKTYSMTCFRAESSKTSFRIEFFALSREPRSFNFSFCTRCGLPWAGLSATLGAEHGAATPRQSHGFPVRSHISGDTSSALALQTAKKWIQDCVKSHQRCEDGTPKALPARILEILDTKSSTLPAIRLLERGPDIQKGRYVCLSHCWGKKQIITTTKETLTDRKQDIPWSSLSKTFQDAITITRNLDLSYIWIDSLCIVQDDIDDWKEQAADMASIYENSFITIAATASLNGEQGCFRDSGPTYRAHSFRFLTDAGHEYEIFARRKLAHCTSWDIHRGGQVETEWPLLTRAWTYQERLLSMRVLHYAQAELWWECIEDSKCECSPDNRNPRDMFKRDPPKVEHGIVLDCGDKDKLLRRWRAIVGEYSRLALTFERDRLYGIQGLANRIGQSLGMSEETYLDGLWAPSLWCELCWYTLVPEHYRRNDVVPTWSWASVTGAGYEGSEPFGSEYRGYITLLDTGLVQLSCESITSTTRYLKILGRMAEATIIYKSDVSEDSPGELEFSETPKAILRFGAIIDREAHGHATFQPDYDIYHAGNDHVPDGTIIHCLYIYSQRVREPSDSVTCRALVLLPNAGPPSTPSSAKYYKRIGYFEYEPKAGVHLNGAWKDIWNEPKKEVYLI